MSAHAIAAEWETAGLSRRTATLLAKENIDDVAKLEMLSTAELLRMPNLGRLTLTEIEIFLGRRPLTFGGPLTTGKRERATLRDYSDGELLNELRRRLSRGGRLL